MKTESNYRLLTLLEAAPPVAAPDASSVFCNRKDLNHVELVLHFSL